MNILKRKEADMRSIEKTLTVTDVATIINGPTRTCEQNPQITRRQFLRAGTIIGLTVTTTGCSLGHNAALTRGRIEQAQALNMRLGASDLVVQPVLMYNISHRQERRSWRPWGGVQTEEAVKKEAARVSRELNQLCSSADFGARALPLAKVANKQQVGDLKDVEADVLLVYAAGGGTDTLNELAALNKSLIIFVRKHSRPYYLWDEIVHSSACL